MAVANRIEKKNFVNNTKEILIAPELAFSIGCLVNATGVTADSDGRKILKAGTPVGGSTDILTNRQTVLSKATTSGEGAAATSNAQGILLHDVDVTDGDTNATLVLKGQVDLYKLDSDVVALLTAQAKANLKDIIFMNGNK